MCRTVFIAVFSINVMGRGIHSGFCREVLQKQTHALAAEPVSEDSIKSAKQLLLYADGPRDLRSLVVSLHSS